MKSIRISMAPSTYKNILASLKRFYRDFLGMKDLVESFRFPEQAFKPIKVPTKEDLAIFYQALEGLRDRALISLLYLTCGGISEVLSLTKKQFVFDEDPDFIIVKNMVVVERKKKAKRKRRSIRDEVPLPKFGPLAPFTHFVMEYLNLLSDSEAKLFKFGRHRAWQIVRFVTGKWCHYFRSQGESWYGKIFSNMFALKDFVGVVDASTLSDYVKTHQKDYRDRILGKAT